jgi:uncharacterized protein (DUF1778 family)
MRNLSIRVDDADFEQIKERAAFHGMTLQDFVLSAAKAEAGIIDPAMDARLRADMAEHADAYAALAQLDPPAAERRAA